MCEWNGLCITTSNSVSSIHSAMSHLKYYLCILNSDFVIVILYLGMVVTSIIVSSFNFFPLTSLKMAT